MIVCVIKSMDSFRNPVSGESSPADQSHSVVTAPCRVSVGYCNTLVCCMLDRHHPPETTGEEEELQVGNVIMQQIDLCPLQCIV